MKYIISATLIMQAHLGFLVDKITLGQIIFSSTWSFSRQCRFINTLYLFCLILYSQRYIILAIESVVDTLEHHICTYVILYPICLCICYLFLCHFQVNPYEFLGLHNDAC
jgi:hypothetical protein